MITLDSRIKAVTVFRSGAQIVRVAPLPPTTECVFKLVGLPLSLLDESLQASVVGEGTLPVVVDFKVGLEVTGTSQEDDLDVRLRHAAQSVDLLSSKKQALQMMQLSLQSLEPQARPPESEGPFRVSRPVQLLDFRSAQRGELDAAISDLEVSLEKAGEELRQLQHQKSLAAPALRPEALEKFLQLRLRGKVESGQSLHLIYRVPGARWAPAYSVRLSADLQSAELSMRAMVAQKTGEDWPDVKLTLSTADPQEWRETPEWKSLRIGRAEPHPGIRWFAPPTGWDKLFEDFDSFRTQLGPVAAKARPQPEEAPLLQSREESKILLDEIDAECDALGGGGRGGAAPAPASAPAEFMKRRVSAPEPAPKPAQAVVLTLSQSSWRFASLRLADYRSPRRGQLVAFDQVHEYCEFTTLAWSEQQLQGALGEAQQRALRIEQAPPPLGHHYPTSQSGFDYAYPAAGVANLLSDGAFHSVPLLAISLQPKLSHICVPSQSLHVFRSIEMANPADSAFPEGPVDIVIGLDYLHTSRLSGVAPKGTFRLGLGVAQDIQVSRQVTFKENSKGMLGGTSELVHNIQLEVANHRPVPVELEIQQCLPQPDPEVKEQVKVTVVSVEPAWEAFAPEDNPLLKSAYRWRLLLEPSSRSKASVNYTIEIPSKNELEGGNRRESRS